MLIFPETVPPFVSNTTASLNLSCYLALGNQLLGLPEMDFLECGILSTKPRTAPGKLGCLSSHPALKYLLNEKTNMTPQNM